MISSKDREYRKRSHGKREARAIGRAQRPFVRRLFLLTGGIALLASYGYWLNSQANGTANKKPAHQKTVGDTLNSPSNIPSIVQRLQQAELAKDDDAMESSLLSLIEMDSGNSKWLMQLCEFYFSQGRWSNATDIFTSNVNRKYSAQEAYRLQGTMLNALINFAKPEEARLILNPLLSRAEKKTMEIAQMEARLLRLEGKSREALSVLKSILPDSQENENLHKLTGILEFDLGQYARAMESLKQAGRLNPYSDSTQFKLAECARLLGDQQAEQAYREKYAQLHAIHQEIASLKMQLEQSPKWTDAQALRLAALYESVGQPHQAAYCRQQVTARSNSR